MKKYLKYCYDVIPVVAFVIISLAYFWNPIQGHKVLTGTDHSGAVGAGVEINEYRQSHDGETPRWTNTLFSGMPTYQMAPSYDSTNTLSRLESWYRLGLPDVAAYVFILLLGFYIMLRCFDFKVWMAALGAVLWAFSSYYFILIAAGHIWKLLTLAFIPPTIGGMALCFRGRYGWGVAISGLFMALQIHSNHVQMTYYFLFPIFMMAIAETISLVFANRAEGTGVCWKEGLGKSFKAGCAFALGCLLGVAVNISNLYHTWEYSKESMRGKSELTQKTKNPSDQTSSGLERSYITMWSYGIDETWTLLVPNTKGGASMPLTRSETAMEKANNSFLQIYQQLGQYWGDQPGTSGPVYVGAFVCFLFVLGLLIVRGPMCWALLLATMLSIALSWGKNFMGFTDFFLDYVPMYDKFRTVASILVIAEFTMPLLAMMALKRYIEDPTCVRVRIPFTDKKVNAIVISFALTAGVCFLFWMMPDLFFGDYMSMQEKEMFQNAVDAGYIPQDIYGQICVNLNDMRRAVFTADAGRSMFIICVGVVLLTLYKYRKANAVVTTVAITLLCLVDMWQVNKRYLNDSMFVYPQTAQQMFPQTEADQQILAAGDKYSRVLDLTTSTFNSNDASYWHKSIGGYHAAKLRRYQEVIEAHLHHEMPALQSAIAQSGANLEQVNGDSIFPVLNMLNMGHVIVPLQSGQKLSVVNPHANGNAWFVSEVRYVDDADAELEMLGKLDLKNQAVADRKFQNAIGESESAQGTAVLTEYGVTELKYEVESQKGGIVVFSDIYYPGWTATVDGQQTALGRADYILRAIHVPAGKHQVIMTFDPQTVHTTEAIAYSALAILAAIMMLMIGLGIWNSRRK